jgi:hypothetical protein
MFYRTDSTDYGILRMHAIDCIAIHSIDDNYHDDDHQKVGDAYRYSVIRRNYSSVLHQVISQPYSVIGQLGIAS